MKLIKPSFKIIAQKAGYEGVIEQVEKAGRIAYKSEDRITEDSAQPFVNMLIKKRHTSVLEHGTIYLKVPNCLEGTSETVKYVNNPYSVVKVGDLQNYYITTNYRVLVQNHWEEDLEFLCEPTEYHEKRIAVKFIIDRGISHEFVRHKIFSFTQESTRYCNYSQNKFNKEITFIIPCWLDIPEGKYTNIAKQSNKDGEYKQIMLHENNTNAYPLTTTSEGRFLWSCYWDEHNYFDLLEQGWTPQQARAVLPNSLKTELFITGTSTQWRDFLSQRTASTAHPQATEIAIPLQAQLQLLNLI